MANSKARSGTAGPPGRPARPAPLTPTRTVPAVSATPTSSEGARPTAGRSADGAGRARAGGAAPARPGQPLWLQVTSLVLAVLGLAISAYETYAHFNGIHLAGCPTGGRHVQLHRRHHQPAVDGLRRRSRWPCSAWRSTWSRCRCSPRGPGGIRAPRRCTCCASASVIVGMGFVMYLIYAELYQIGYDLRVLHRRAHRDVPAVLHHRVQRRHLGTRQAEAAPPPAPDRPADAAPGHAARDRMTLCSCSPARPGRGRLPLSKVTACLA